MKFVASITLIVCGTIITLVPYIHSTLAMSSMSRILIANNGQKANISTTIPDWYDTWSFLLGVFMIIAGLFLTFRMTSESKSGSR